MSILSLFLAFLVIFGAVTHFSQYIRRDFSNDFTSLSEAVNMVSKRIFAIEGGIGVGKSSLIQAFRRLNSPAIATFEEPVGKWSKLVLPSGEINCLEKFYKDPTAQNAFNLQCIINSTLVDRALAIRTRLEVDPAIIVVQERSFLSCRDVFVQVNKRLLGEFAYKINFTAADQNYRIFEKNITHIYLSVSEATMLERFNKRSRCEEMTSGTVEYIKRVKRIMDSWAALNDYHFVVADQRTPTEIMYEILDIVLKFY